MVVSPEELDTTAGEFIKKLTKGSQFALTQIKENIDRGTKMAVFNCIQMEANLFTLCYKQEDF
ncbi:MAG: hypothetical protein ACXAC6_16490 [Candidatus Hodarchaeales archaeon]|jgi:enoyl-CoA hydratase/carnithine racemase